MSGHIDPDTGEWIEDEDSYVPEQETEEPATSPTSSGGDWIDELDLTPEQKDGLRRQMHGDYSQPQDTSVTPVGMEGGDQTSTQHSDNTTDGSYSGSSYQEPMTGYAKLLDLATKAGTTAADYLEKHPSLAQSLLGGIGAAFKDKSAKEIAGMQLDYLKSKQDAMNNSVKSYGGIIGSAIKK